MSPGLKPSWMKRRELYKSVAGSQRKKKRRAPTMQEIQEKANSYLLRDHTIRSVAGKKTASKASRYERWKRGIKMREDARMKEARMRGKPKGRVKKSGDRGYRRPFERGY